MHDIFISYASDDRGRLTGLVAALEEQGWSVWWDHQSIQPGETWDETIEQAVKAAQCVVVAWSEASVRSRWVRAEAMVGLENGCLVPVLIDPVELPIAFKGTQSADLTGNADFTSVINAVAANLRRPVEPSRPKKSRLGWIFGLVTIALLAGLVAYKWLDVLPDASSINTTVAVLPLENLSASEYPYFADAVTGEILGALAAVPQLNLISRSSVGRLRRGETDFAKLNITHLVEGSARRTNTRFDVSAELVDANTGLVIWSIEFSDDLGEVSEVLRSIAEQTASALGLGLGGRRPAPKNWAAYSAYLDASILANSGAYEPRALIERAQRAVELDPEFAPAQALHGQSWLMLANTGEPSAYENAEKALTLARKLDPEWYLTYGFLVHLTQQGKWDWTGAKEFGDHMLGLAPGVSLSYFYGAHGYLFAGDYVKARALLDRALALDPLSSNTWRRSGMLHYISGNLAMAEQHYRRSLELNPRMFRTHSRLMQLYWELSRFSDAVDVLVDVCQLLGETAATTKIAELRRSGGHRAVWIWLVESIRDNRQGPLARGTTPNIAIRLAELGEVDAALDALENEVDAKSWEAPWIAVDPTYAVLHGSPRYGQLLDRMGFQDFHSR